MKTRMIIGIVLALFLCQGSITLMAQSEGDFKVKQLRDGNLEITGYTGSSMDIVIPGTINGKAVTSIGKGAFKGKRITSVVIPETVTAIGADAFSGCRSLTQATIPVSVTTIGKNAFAKTGVDEKALPADLRLTNPEYFEVEELADGTLAVTKFRGSDKNVVVPRTINGRAVTVIGDDSFYHCSALISVVIPNSVTKIENRAFMDCSALTSVVIPNSVTKIGQLAFFRCSALTSVVIPDSVTEIEEGAFSGCTALTSVVVPFSVAKLDYSGLNQEIVSDWKARKEAVRLAELAALPTKDEDFTVQQLANNTIRITGYTGKASNVVIPGTLYGLKVTVIGSGAFSRAKDLVSVVIPDSVITIEGSAFTDLKISKLTIGKGVKTIGRSAFSGNNLTELVIPDSVIEIGSRAFFRGNLTSLTFGRNVQTIGAAAFANNQLTEITIPAGVKELSANVFTNNKITSLTLPNGITRVGEGDTSFYGRQASGDTAESVFGGNPLTTLVIPASLAKYSTFTSSQWSGWLKEGIYEAAFSGCPITRITLPANMDERNMAGFDTNLINFWKSQGKKAGTYVKNGPVWTRE